jgi:hypothetical protein
VDPRRSPRDALAPAPFESPAWRASPSLDRLRGRDLRLHGWSGSRSAADKGGRGGTNGAGWHGYDSGVTTGVIGTVSCITTQAVLTIIVAEIFAKITHAPLSRFA